MAIKIDKTALAQKINALEGLDAESKSQLLELLHERKRYGLIWEEKEEDVEERLRNELPVLQEVKERAILSDDPEAPNHILIEGDNLEALTTLSYTHENQIDVIYIDPPYNTGNKDFVYNDRFVDADDEYRHSKWLSFMAKRLRIAKRLLSDKGVIFISIDDNEQAALKLLCDEVFEEKNFVGGLIHQRAKGGGQAKYIVKGHDYILVYARSISCVSLGREKVVQKGVVEIEGELYIKNDDVVRKVFGKYDKSMGNRRCFYEQLVQYKGQQKKEEIDELLNNGELFLEENSEGMHTICRYEKLSAARSKMYSIIKVLSEEGKKELENLGLVDKFSYPKPLELLYQIINSVIGNRFLCGFGNYAACYYAIECRRRRAPQVYPCNQQREPYLRRGYLRAQQACHQWLHYAQGRTGSRTQEQHAPLLPNRFCGTQFVGYCQTRVDACRYRHALYQKRHLYRATALRQPQVPQRCTTLLC